MKFIGAGAIFFAVICAAAPGVHKRPTVLDEKLHTLISEMLHPDRGKLLFGVPAAKFLIPHSLKDAPTQEIEGYSFYRRSLVPSTEAAVRGLLVRAFQRFEQHRPHSGVPPACEFHPDFALTSEFDGKRVTLFVCLGCKEWDARIDGREYSAAMDPSLAEALVLLRAVLFADFAKQANKALEPTPGSVTPRAIEEKAK